MLSERQNNILKIIVEEYIKSAHPVGSKHVSKTLSYSSATIRNEMMCLEELELLEKTHTSSGRIPSEKGYRYYVDNLMKPADLNGEDMLKLQTIFRNNSLVLSDSIKKSIEIISEMTNYTMIMLGPTSKENKLKKVESIPLDKNKILTMIITDRGYVEYKNMIVNETISTNEIKQTVDIINKILVGTPIDEINSKLEFEVKPVIQKFVVQHEAIYDAFYNAFNDISSKTSDVQFVGKNNFLKQPEFNNIDKIKDILNKFEDVNTIKKITEKDDGISIYIGKENELSDEVSIVKTKINLDGEEKTIAIIGPKRMEYNRVVSLLNYINDHVNGG